MSQTYNLGLIGYPLGHSLSPQIHNAALRSLGLEGEYNLYPILPLPEGEKAISELLQRIRAGTIHGLNVTIPHKQNVIPMLDYLTPSAKAIGAVNTIFLSDEKLVGDNTDAPGFVGDLKRLLKTQQIQKNALVLGSGGAARAVIYALLSEGYQITLSVRPTDFDQAQNLIDQISHEEKQIEVVETGRWAHDIEIHSLVVNATPVGMHPMEDQSPWPEGLPFPTQAAVYDLVYNPRQTLFTKQALEAGLSATTGLGMLIEQAALAFERWTGLEAPRQVMAEAVEPQL